MRVSDLTIEEFETIIHKVVEDEIEDLYYALDTTIKTKIEEGLRDIKEGRTIPIDNLIAKRQSKSGKI